MINGSKEIIELFWHKLSFKLLLPFLMLLFFGISGTLYFLPYQIQSHLEEEMISNTLTLMNQFKTLRDFHSDNHTGTGFKTPFHLPLPLDQTLTSSSNQKNPSLQTLKIYTLHPSLDPGDTHYDPFRKEAWLFFQQHPKKPYIQSKTLKNKQILRIAIANTMHASSCLECHNSYLGTLKSDWKSDELSGVFETTLDQDFIAKQSRNIGIHIATSLGGGILVIAFIYMVLVHGIIKRTHSIKLQITDIKNGKPPLMVSISPFPDELDTIVLHLNQLANDLATRSKLFEGATKNIQNATTDISTTLEQQSLEIRTQSQWLKDITRGLETLSQITIKTIDPVIQRINHAHTSNQEGGERLEGMRVVTEQMGLIAEDHHHRSTEIAKLQRESKEVGKVVGIIKNIANQTKLLALNASLEASSTGETGKRFGVVAGEIRRLANSVAKTTDEVEQHILEMQESITLMVRGLASSNRHVKQGVQAVNKVTHSLTPSAEELESTTNTLSQITQLSKKQKTTANQVSDNLKHLEKGISKHEITLMRVVFILNDLKGQTDLLKQQLEHFSTR